MAGNNSKKRVSAGTRKKLLLQPNIKAGVNVRQANILFAVSAEATQTLKDNISQCMRKLKDRTMETVEWDNLQFRLYMGAGLAKEHFTDEVYKDIIDSINTLFEIQDRWIRMGANIYAATDEEFDDLQDALDLIDAMQEMSTRREMLIITNKVKAFLAKSNGNRITRNGILVAQ